MWLQREVPMTPMSSTDAACRTIQSGWRTLRLRFRFRQKAAKYDALLTLLRSTGLVRPPASAKPPRRYSSADVERDLQP